MLFSPIAYKQRNGQHQFISNLQAV